VSWSPGAEFCPRGAELAHHLAAEFEYPEDDASDLMRVATYSEARFGRRALYQELRQVFDRPYLTTPLHHFLMQCVKAAQADRSNAPLIVTTNYDDILERALNEAELLFDVVSYLADGDLQGKFCHWPCDGGEPIVITQPRSYGGLAMGERTTILKIHGTIDRTNEDGDSFVISENQYVDYLSGDVWHEIPLAIVARLRRSHFLFLGYAMRDWNLLVVLRRLGLLLGGDYASWAVQLNQTELDILRWRERNVDSLDLPLDEYVVALDLELAGLDQ
jgi:hypothetical protein